MDGTASAWVIKQYLKGQGRNIRYVFASKRNLAADIAPLTVDDLKGKDIFVVDYSYEYDTLLTIEYNTLTLIDHHVTAEVEMEKCRDLRDCRVIFSKDRCGAYLAWENLIGGNMPWWISYVDDRDRYTFALPNSRIINDALYNLGYRTFAKFDELCKFQQVDIDALIEKGQKMGDVKDNIVKSITGGAQKIMFEGYTAYVVNNATLISEVGEELLKKDDCQIALCFYYPVKEKMWRVRMRSKDVDISVIARKYGGGGHEKAAAFTYNGDILTLLSLQ